MRSTQIYFNRSHAETEVARVNMITSRQNYYVSCLMFKAIQNLCTVQLFSSIIQDIYLAISDLMIFIYTTKRISCY